jgi:hypothetical protein
LIAALSWGLDSAAAADLEFVEVDCWNEAEWLELACDA